MSCKDMMYVLVKWILVAKNCFAANKKRATADNEKSAVALNFFDTLLML